MVLSYKGALKGIFTTLVYFGIGAAIAIGITPACDKLGVTEYLATKSVETGDNINSVFKAKKGTALVSIYDKDGLDAVVLSNNTENDKNLTQIPPIRIHNLYDKRLTVSLGDLKKGHYVFSCEMRDDLGNIVEKTYELNIENHNGGKESIYKSRVEIDNKFMPGGKEKFNL